MSFGLVVVAVIGAALAGGDTAFSSIAAAAILALGIAMRPWAGLAAFLVVLLLADLVEHWFGVSLQYVDEAGIPLLLVVMATTRWRHLRLFRPGAREAGLALLVIAAIASSVSNAVPAGIWVPALGLLGKGFILFYAMVVLPISEEDLRGFLSALLAVGLSVAAIGIVQFAAPEFVSAALNLPHIEQQRGDIAVVNAIFTHPALYGWLTAFLSLYFYARFTAARDAPALGFALLLNIASVLSGRRTPIVGVVAGLIVGVLRQVSLGTARRRVLVPIGLAGVTAIALSIPMLGDFYRSTLIEYGERVEVMAEVFADEPDALALSELQPRTALYLGSVAIARDDFPIGAGLGRFGSHMSRVAYSPEYARYGLDRIWGLAPHVPIAVTDTFWPMILGETGILGFTGVVVFFTALGRDLWRGAGKGAPLLVGTASLWSLMVFGETMVRSLTSSVFVAPPIAMFVFATFAMALAAKRDLSTGESDLSRRVMAG